MAKITSRADLNVGTEITLDTSTRKIRLHVAGNLVAKDGVTLQAVYSKLIALWNTATYNDYDFPMYAKDARSGQFIIGYNGVTYNGWTWYDDTTRSYLRDGGWSEYNSSGVLQKQYVGIVSLGNLASSGIQTYYQVTNGGSATNFTFTDAPNEGIKVYDVSGPVDTRAYFKAYARAYNYTYDESDLTDTGLTATGAYKVNVLLSNVADTHITDNDATVTANAPYTGITVTWLDGNGFTTASVGSLVANDVRQDTVGRWFICTSPGTIDAAGVADYTANGGTATLASYTGEREIDGDYYAFNIIVDGNAANREQIYTKIQYLLRQNSDIDSGAGTHTGKITQQLMNFLGETLVTTTGVYIDDTQSTDSAFLVYTDVGGVERSIPVVTNQSVTITGPVAGSRIQIYDLTSNTELYNGTPTFPYTWTDPNVYVADREIRLRVAYVNGTSAKKYISTTIGTATAVNYALTYLVAQEDDDVYNTNAVDGSTVTGITINDVSNRHDLDKSGGTLTLQDWYAYSLYYRFTSVGIAGGVLALTATDTANYTLTGKTIKNTSSPSVPLKITGGWITDGDTGDPIDLIDTSGGTIFLAPPHVVAYEAAGATSNPLYVNTTNGDVLKPL